MTPELDVAAAVAACFRPHFSIIIFRIAPVSDASTRTGGVLLHERCPRGRGVSLYGRWR